jgi:hypothetical protein
VAAAGDSTRVRLAAVPKPFASGRQPPMIEPRGTREAGAGIASGKRVTGEYHRPRGSQALR